MCVESIRCGSKSVFKVEALECCQCRQGGGKKRGRKRRKTKKTKTKRPRKDSSTRQNEEQNIPASTVLKAPFLLGPRRRHRTTCCEGRADAALKGHQQREKNKRKPEQKAQRNGGQTRCNRPEGGVHWSSRFGRLAGRREGLARKELLTGRCAAAESCLPIPGVLPPTPCSYSTNDL